MTQLGMNCTIKGKVSHEECRRCAMHEHPCEYPVDVLEMMREENDVQHDRTEFTPSTLLECKRRVVLRTSNDYYVDPAQKWKMLRGEMVHMFFEKKGRFPQGSVVDVLREVRLKTSVDTKYGPQVFSGKADLIVINSIEDGVAHVSITDYKTTEINHDKDGFSEDHDWVFREQQMQINMYGWLAQRELPTNMHTAISLDRLALAPGTKPIPKFTRVMIDELQLSYVDFKKMRRFTSKRQLVTRGKLVSRANWEYAELPLAQIHILPFEVTEQFIISTIEEMIEAKSELPPLLDGKKAQVVCPLCPLQSVCYSLAHKVL